MEKFRKSYINAAAKYAEYVGAKITAITATAEIKAIGPGSVTFCGDNPLETAKVLYEEMRTLNQTAEILKMESSVADPEESQPRRKKVLTYKDGRPRIEEI